MSEAGVEDLRAEEGRASVDPKGRASVDPDGRVHVQYIRLGRCDMDRPLSQQSGLVRSADLPRSYFENKYPQYLHYFDRIQNSGVASRMSGESKDDAAARHSETRRDPPPKRPFSKSPHFHNSRDRSSSSSRSNSGSRTSDSMSYSSNMLNNLRNKRNRHTDLVQYQGPQKTQLPNHVILEEEERTVDKSRYRDKAI